VTEEIRDMPYTISQTGQEGIWVVEYSGTIDNQARLAALAEGLEKAKGKKLRGILVDFRNASLEMSTFEQYEFGSRKSAQAQLHGVKTAFLHRKDDRKTGRLIEPVARNRGIMARVFTDKAEAMNWIARDDPDPMD
jgi:hypothetical protein